MNKDKVIDAYTDLGFAEDLYLKRYNSVNTIRAQRVAFSNFEKFLIAKKIELYDFDSSYANEFVEFLITKSEYNPYPKSNRSANDMVRKIAHFFDFLIYISKEAGITEFKFNGQTVHTFIVNPFEQVKMLPIPREEYSDRLNIQDILEALNYVRHDSVKASLLLCAFAGLRSNEPSKLTADNIFLPYKNSNELEPYHNAQIEDIDITKLWKIRIIGGKGNQNRETFFLLPAFVNNALSKLYDAFNSVTYTEGEKRGLPKPTILPEENYIFEARHSRTGKPMAYKGDIVKHIQQQIRAGAYMTSASEGFIDPQFMPPYILATLKQLSEKSIESIMAYYSSINDIRDAYNNLLQYYNLLKFIIDRMRYAYKILEHEYLFSITAQYMRSEISLYVQPNIDFNFHIHALRHWFATYLAERGFSIYAISRYLGHSSVSTTEIYINRTADEIMEQEEDKLYD